VRDLIRTQLRYGDEAQPLEGYLASPPQASSLPAVLVAPSWLNVAAPIRLRADRVAEQGYTVFVADLFGAGVHPCPPQSPQEVIEPFLSDRLRFRQRLLAGLSALQGRPECRVDRIAAIGYCLGGCGVLELARAGASLRGVVSLHGMLNAPVPSRRDALTARVLVLHGDADPLVPFEQLSAFRDEMRTAGANWEIDIYSDARHAFTGEGASGGDSPEAGFHPQAEERSWQATTRFLREVLS
jgi:dienelactone hydrolase